MSYGYSSGGGLDSTLGSILFVFLVLYLIAWYLTMQIVTKAAKEKGYEDLGGKLWFIGLFGLIFTPPIIVSSLPDKKLQDASSQSAAAATSTANYDELPDL